MSQNNKKPPADFDGSYRKLLSNELLLRQLLERFVAAELLGELDFETLERVETSFLKRDMRRRHSDVLWKLKRKNTHGDYIYCVLLLELQSSPDPLMALRILDYAVEIYRQQIIANRSRVLEHGLPPLLPIVLHHSNQTWSAKTNLGDLIALDASDPLFAYQPGQRYLLLDEHELGTAVLEDEENIPAQLFKLHGVDDAEAFATTLSKLIALFQANSIPFELLTSWLHHTLSHTNPVAKISKDELITIITPKGLTMFPQNFFEMIEKEQKKGYANGVERGIEQGIEQGIERGIEQGGAAMQVSMLAKLLERKFGPREDRVEELTALTTRQREQLADLIFDLEDERALFEHATRSS